MEYESIFEECNFEHLFVSLLFQKCPSRGVLRKRCSENMQQIYRRTPMPKCDFNKVASNFNEIILWHTMEGCFLLPTFVKEILDGKLHFCAAHITTKWESWEGLTERTVFVF